MTDQLRAVKRYLHILFVVILGDYNVDTLEGI